MLAQTPLWRFAIRVYPDFKAELLAWQLSHQVSVNDLLALAFASAQGYQLPDQWWRDDFLVQIRRLTIRTRALRENLKGQVHYPCAKSLELNLEAIDIIRLQQLFTLGDCLPNIHHYANHSGIKKGAIAPLIKRLSVN